MASTTAAAAPSPVPSPAQRQIDEWLQNENICSLYIEDDPDVSALPTIPDMVSNLVIRNCPKLLHVHALPQSLKYLQITDCPLLETLPRQMSPNLVGMNIQTETCISILPTFTESLAYLMITNAKQLKHIEHLPASVNYIYIRGCPLISLPSQLPTNLCKLVISDSEIVNLPPLPDALNLLEISSPYLESVPPFPNSLQTIRIKKSPISTIPSLPASLYELDVGGTTLSALPPLPIGLIHLYIDSTLITELPELPQSLTMLSCTHTNIRQLPRLPEELNVLNIAHTRINYLKADDFANTQIYQMYTHARTCDRFPDSVKFINFTDPNFQILDSPLLSKSIVTFAYEGTIVCINPAKGADIAQYTRIKQIERTNQITRIEARTRLYKEELMIRTWHTSRVEDWCGVRFDTIDD
jgi:hypothetical protein